MSLRIIYGQLGLKVVDKMRKLTFFEDVDDVVGKGHVAYFERSYFEILGFNFKSAILFAQQLNI